jgi:hypothetical protein
MYAQNQDWEVYIGQSNKDEYPYDILEYYDKGFCIGSWAGDNNGYGWHIKTDVNGMVLYDKIMYHDEGQPGIQAIVSDSTGNIYICGVMPYQGLFPYVVKFDSCHQKVWCKFFPGNQYEFAGGALDIIINSFGDIIILAYYNNEQVETSLIYLIALDDNGNELWKKPYASKENYPLIEIPIGYKLIEVNNEYYISGYCYWPYPNNPTHVYQRPMFIGVDSEFNEKWLVPFYALDSVYGKAYSCIALNDTVIMGVGLRRNDGSKDFSLLMFLKTNGEELGYSQITNEQIGQGINNNYTHDIVRVNDSLFLAAAPFGEDLSLNPVGELIIDTAANLYKFHSRPNTEQKPSMVKTFDNNYVIATSIKQGNDFDIYLYKIDENLESVPFDTTAHVYDSLCPHTIQSGIIDLTDCLVVTNIGELPGPAQYYESLRWIPIKAYPNPVKDGKVTLEFEHTEHHSNMELRCYNSFGRQIHSQKIYKGQQDTDVNVATWPKGVYIAVIYSNGGAVGKCKVVVE